MKFIQRREQHLNTYVEIDGQEFPAGEVEQVLNGLEDTSYGNTVVIYNSDLALVLEGKKVLCKTIRGGCYEGTMYEDFRKQFEKLLGELPDDEEPDATHCSKCGGEKDNEGWCANYCQDEPKVKKLKVKFWPVEHQKNQPVSFEGESVRITKTGVYVDAKPVATLEFSVDTGLHWKINDILYNGFDFI